MRRINEISKIKFLTDWSGDIDSSVIHRHFIYKKDLFLILLKKNLGLGYSIRIINENGNDLNIFNFGFETMFLEINSQTIRSINGWYFEDLMSVKNKLEKDLINLLGIYEKHLN